MLAHLIRVIYNTTDFFPHPPSSPNASIYSHAFSTSRIPFFFFPSALGSCEENKLMESVPEKANYSALMLMDMWWENKISDTNIFI